MKQGKSKGFYPVLTCRHFIPDVKNRSDTILWTADLFFFFFNGEHKQENDSLAEIGSLR